MRLLDDPSVSSDLRSPRVAAGGLAWPMLFSVTETWAVLVVLTQLRVTGVQDAALALVVSGAMLAIWSEWKVFCSLSRALSKRSRDRHRVLVRRR